MSALGATNPQLQRLRRLSRRRSSRTEEGAYVVDGPVLVAEALDAGVELEAVYVETAGADRPAVRAAREAGVPVREVVDGALTRVLDLVSPQPVAAVARATTTDAGAVWSAAAGGAGPVLVLVALQDPGNAGTLVRVAEAAGCAGVVTTAGSVDLRNPKCVRASAGSLFRVPAAEGVDADVAVGAALAAGLAVVATAGHGGTPPEDAPLAAPVALLVGSEAHGLPADVAARATVTVSVPMAGRVDSLNAGVAGALVAFEAARQRRAARPGPAPGGPGAERSGGGSGPLRHDVGP